MVAAAVAAAAMAVVAVASRRPTLSRASSRSASWWSPKGSRQLRSVPEKSTGSWGMMTSPRGRRALTSRSGTVERSTPSTRMRPPASGSTSRNSAAAIVDLPAPWDRSIDRSEQITQKRKEQQTRREKKDHSIA